MQAYISPEAFLGSSDAAAAFEGEGTALAMGLGEGAFTGGGTGLGAGLEAALAIFASTYNKPKGEETALCNRKVSEQAQIIAAHSHFSAHTPVLPPVGQRQRNRICQS